MKTIRVLDSTGDTVLQYDPTDTKAAREAEALFGRLMSEGSAAFRTGADGGKITSLDQAGEETIVIPRVVGG